MSVTRMRISRYNRTARTSKGVDARYAENERVRNVVHGVRSKTITAEAVVARAVICQRQRVASCTRCRR